MWHTGNGAAVLQPGEARLRNSSSFTLQSGSFIHQHRRRAAPARDGRRNCRTNPEDQKVTEDQSSLRLQVVQVMTERQGEESHREPPGWRRFRQLLPRWRRCTCTSRRQTAESVRWPTPDPASEGSDQPHWSADGRLCTKWWLGRKEEEMSGKNYYGKWYEKKNLIWDWKKANSLRLRFAGFCLCQTETNGSLKLQRTFSFPFTNKKVKSIVFGCFLMFL